MIEIHTGDLLDFFDRGEVSAIAHCCNCQGVMGSGIAKAIKARYPSAYSAYKEMESSMKQISAYTVGDQEMFDRIVRVVENFSGARVVASINAWNGKAWELTCPVVTVLADGSRACDNMSDTFYSWTNESGHGSTEDFVSTMGEIGADDDTIKVFIFSSRQNISTETYYDG